MSDPTPVLRRAVKDAGGFHLANGTRLRPGLALRISGGLARAGELEQLEAAGLRAIVDLRNHHEDRAELAEWAERHGVRYENQPMLATSMEELAATISQADDLATARRQQVALYLRMVDDHAQEVAQTMEILAGDGPIGFGCAAGKDRTGIATAVLHVVLGATREEAAAAYVTMSPTVEQLLPLARSHFDLAEDDELPPAVVAHMTVEAATMLEVFAHIDRHHGGLDA